MIVLKYLFLITAGFLFGMFLFATMNFLSLDKSMKWEEVTILPID